MKAFKRIFPLLLAVVLCGCFAARAETEEPVPPTQIPYSTTQPTGDTVQTEPAVTGSVPVILHSGIREDGTFDGHTLFLGDSLTHMFLDKYLDRNGYLGDAKMAARFGAFLGDFFSRDVTMDENSIAPCLYSPEFAGLGFADAAALMGEDAHAIYMMFGTNYNSQDTAQDYIDIVEYLLRVCPNATIHMQLIPYGELPTEIVNERVTTACHYFREAGEQRVLLIDTYTAIGDRPSDGIHQSDYGNSRWYQCLLDHARDNQLSQ